jgi:hypothetical protein
MGPPPTTSGSLFGRWVYGPSGGVAPETARVAAVQLEAMKRIRTTPVLSLYNNGGRSASTCFGPHIICVDPVSTSRSPHVLHATECYTADSGKRGATVTDLPKSSEEQQDYFSYLLRLWKTGGGERLLWRASLKSVHDGQQVGFASLEDLFHFLRTCTSTVRASEGDGQEPP